MKIDGRLSGSILFSASEQVETRWGKEKRRKGKGVVLTTQMRFRGDQRSAGIIHIVSRGVHMNAAREPLNQLGVFTCASEWRENKAGRAWRDIAHSAGARPVESIRAQRCSLSIERCVQIVHCAGRPARPTCFDWAFGIQY